MSLWVKLYACTHRSMEISGWCIQSYNLLTLLGTLENNSIQCSVVAVDCAGPLQQNNSSTQGSFDRFVNSLMHQKADCQSIVSFLLYMRYHAVKEIISAAITVIEMGIVHRKSWHPFAGFLPYSLHPKPHSL